MKLNVVMRGLCRVAVVRASSTCGRRVTVVSAATTVTVTATRTASTRCPSAARRSSSSHRGTPNIAPPPWPPPTPVLLHHGHHLLQRRRRRQQDRTLSPRQTRPELVEAVVSTCRPGAVLGKNIWGPGPSSFGRQQRLSEITIEPIASNMWKS